MQYHHLARTELNVSAVCLGTMTWGEQNALEDAHQQMDYALERGINFFDTAEMYAVPPRPETYGRTEEIIGEWFRRRGTRDRVVLATKVAGGSDSLYWVRSGRTRLDRDNIKTALEESLRRLQTDCIDLYQLHWPDRATNRFGQLGYARAPEALEPGERDRMRETLSTLNDAVEAGKIRYIGLSNETAWGTMTFLQLAEQEGWPRPIAIQNPYSLLNRTFEIDLSEIAVREDCGLLAYSPLAGGTLTGKYLDGRRPPGSRRTIDERGSRYETERGEAATREYVAITQRHGLDPAQMALAFVNRQPFLSANIIGATTLEQLQTNIDAAELTLSDEVMAEIEAVHQRNPNPCP